MALACLDSRSLQIQPAWAVSPFTRLIGSVALVCSLLLWISNTSVAQVVLAWDDPNNNSVEVGGYNLYYWQPDWDMPAKVDVGKTTMYTLTDLEAGQTYTFTVTAYDVNNSRESVFSNEISITLPVMDLVAAYSFNEGSGTTVIDVTSNANDGTISGATRTTQGRFGRALSFDGVNDVVRLQDSADLDLTTGMTLEAWVYPTTAPTGWRTILHKEVDAYFLHAGSNRNTPAAGGTFNGVCCQVVYAPAPLAVRRWTHLAATYDGIRLRLYINGAQVANRPVSGALETNTSPLSIGGNSPAGEYFQGRIDEARIYNRALTASEIQTDMNTPVAPPP